MGRFKDKFLKKINFFWISRSSLMLKYGKFTILELAGVISIKSWKV